jgi:hypothetical protein
MPKFLAQCIAEREDTFAKLCRRLRKVLAKRKTHRQIREEYKIRRCVRLLLQNGPPIDEEAVEAYNKIGSHSDDPAVDQIGSDANLSGMPCPRCGKRLKDVQAHLNRNTPACLRAAIS